MSRVFLEATMKRFVLIIGVGLLVANVAYAAPNSCRTTCTDITKKVCNLPSGYDPTQKQLPKGCASVGGKSRAVTRAKRDLATYAGQIQAAFAMAPAGLQQCVCSLKQIYVTTDPKYGSWGKWEGRGSQQSVIAFLDTDLNSANLPALLMGRLAAQPLNISPAVGQYTDNNPSNPGNLAVLYVLAHEMGHMAFRRDYMSLSSCTLDGFLMTSWTNWQNWRQWVAKPWTSFGEIYGQLNGGIPAPTKATAGDLQKIYQSSLPTALGDANPEEDFVESYALEAINLATANSYKLSITIPAAGGQSYPVNYGRSSLTPKFQCVDSILQ
jgi:hypothetical protein